MKKEKTATHLHLWPDGTERKEPPPEWLAKIANKITALQRKTKEDK